MASQSSHGADRIALAWTGASGAAYGLRLLEQLLAAGVRVELIVSKAAQVVLGQETDLDLPAQPEAMREALVTHLGCGSNTLRVYGREQWTAPVASGSNAPRAMVVCPCTSGTVAAIANGTSDNLIERAADVTIKERRQLVLVHRETPLSLIHLENMTRLARMGVTILPANPGFYHRPATVEELVDFVVARVLDHLEVDHELVPRWAADEERREAD
ncbi:aromatic acid decarboxylase [Thiohalorhabdus denitrificans]|uniref:Flavin prenyltransferase UbiX n=1 Tax=Thiohalorhabdus denitrificans TaxID=381306 RepID=A0A0P9GHQ0_9GAMM|nr:flavin prenyltransferase UbiX [Thiohalorhabdus denitrificans]KPV39528.1 aromatic acid decarboxylase [Thiohalorhabdus denitrificans]SCX99693.1 4-hydroxy-3-polyprenylbenzoate decarboxylase [Thiohalorhabdus denitrificans]